MINIHKEGYLIILLFVVLDLIFFSFSNKLGWIGIIGVVWCVYFFRDPNRFTPPGDNIIVSPADGIIQMITTAVPPKELNMPEVQMNRISIFLNIFDVHVNRIPLSGKVNGSHYRPGKFFNASLDKASIDNERQSIWIKDKYDQDFAVVQIAGLIARRIVCDLSIGSDVNTGDRFGIIRFGSRVDLYLPLNIKPKVITGQRMIGGETIIAENININNLK
ncbi:Phosphatidylserine decarboxylase proenzyme [Lyticum sinuosum]|uniref:Phosphatidylserine decarboxylase proenzyme n=2 Tax=Lyticum sinuosum TaxID=1332059 RepID=A0AAE4VLR4_9RICK|nr:Phosphatidylserine decarboxylase proenzyme [Lyticum sinuosum]